MAQMALTQSLTDPNLPSRSYKTPLGMVLLFNRSIAKFEIFLRSLDQTLHDTVTSIVWPYGGT